jgi:hypothetical protein
LIIAASTWRRFSMMLCPLVDCDQLFEVLNPVIGERHHPVFTDANDP